uniref:Uncharacterized protein n=1 Tax=Stomoxys calcitrans TaxID=35570 RepID=A0A1I8Q9G2_STOCA
MNSIYKVLLMLGLLVAQVHLLPVAQPQTGSEFLNELVGNIPLGTAFKESDLVKRRVYEVNPDRPERELKQISLQSLIGDLEQSLFASALSVHDVARDKTALVPEIKPNHKEDLPNEQHQVTKRHLDDNGSSTTESHKESATTKSPQVAGKSGDEHLVILQTTEKVPETAGVPAHIIIDRIAIQPHSGGSVALVPTFEIKRTHNGNGDKPSEITKISISKTEISSVPNIPAPATSTTASSTDAPTTTTTTTSAPSSTAASTTAKPTTVAAASVSTESTTVKNIEQLKEAELELKEKVAEIEAEPVILSARV